MCVHMFFVAMPYKCALARNTRMKYALGGLNLQAIAHYKVALVLRVHAFKPPTTTLNT